jgi:hypothetical protein
VPSVLTFTGSIPFDNGVDSSLLPEYMAHRLEEVKASSVQIEPQQVIFKVKVFRLVSSCNVVVLYRFRDTADSRYVAEL